MYYTNDGVYGSFNCILFDHAIAKPMVLTQNFNMLGSSAVRGSSDVVVVVLVVLVVLVVVVVEVESVAPFFPPSRLLWADFTPDHHRSRVRVKPVGSHL